MVSVRGPRAFLLFVLVVTPAFLRADVPKILLLQMQAPLTSDGVDLNVQMIDSLAQELQDGGKVSPIAWTISDPVFREAMVSGQIRKIPEKPDLRTAQGVAKDLKAEYLLSFEAKQVGLNVQSSVQLYRNGRSIWKDSQSIRLEGTTEGKLYDAMRSVARTIALKVQSEPLKALPVAPKVATTDITQGQLPITPVPDRPVETPTNPPVNPNTPEPPKVDTSAEELAALKNEVQQLITAGRFSAAVVRLRESIDQRPFDFGRRQLLVETLLITNPEAAAQEARRASNLNPDSPDMRIVAARAWIEAGKPGEAQTELNEVLARHPESIPTRLLLAEIALRGDQAEQALEHVNVALKSQPTAEAHYLRALVRAVLGGKDGVEQDLTAAHGLSPETSPTEAVRRYRLTVAVLDTAFDRLSNNLKDLLPRAAVRPKDNEIRVAVEEVLTLTAAHEALMSAQNVPADAKQAHARRVLARKLLVQSAQDLIAYSEGNKDAIADARINLGDAIRQMGTARKEWSPSANGTASGS